MPHLDQMRLKVFKNYYFYKRIYDSNKLNNFFNNWSSLTTLWILHITAINTPRFSVICVTKIYGIDLYS